MSVRHELRREDVDLTRLRGELSTRLGFEVELVSRTPTTDDPDGVLIVEDAAGGTRIDVDPAVVAEVVAAHAPRVSAAREALAALRAADTVPGRLAAVEGYLARLVAEEDRRRSFVREVG